MLTELYPPFIGGSEQYVRNLSRELVKRGHEVSVATVGAGEPSTDDEEGVRVHRLRSTTQSAPSMLPSGRPYLPPFPDPAVARALGDILDRERPDIVHAHNWMVHSFLPHKRRSGARLVMTLHDYEIACAKRSLMYRGAECSGPGLEKCLRCAGANYGTAKGMVVTLGNWATRPPLLRSVDLFVAVSNAVVAGNELDRHGATYTVIPNFAPDDVVATADTTDPQLAALPEEPFWLYVGALSVHKGVPVLLDAYRRLADSPPLVLIGRSSDFDPHPLPANVTLISNLRHAAVMAAWQRAALGIVPSRFPDPCPTVAIEAMACGVPVVGSRSGGLPDLVADGESGVLVPPGDAAALAAALQRINAAPDALDAMSAAARARAPRFMAGSVVERIELVYRALFDNG